MVSDLKKFLIRSLPLIAVLFTCVVILSSAAIFASEESTPSSEVSSDIQLVIPEEYKDPVYDKLASGGDVRAVTYTTTDIYNLLNSALYGEGTTDQRSLARIAYYTHLSSNNASNIYQQIQYLNKAIYGGGNSSGFASDFNLLFSLQYNNGTEYVGLADLVADFPALTYASVNQLLGAQQNSNYYLSQISSNLSSYNWISYPGYQYLGTSSGLNYTWLSNSGSYSSVSSAFKFTDQNNPYLVRVQLPVYYNSRDYNISDFSLKLFSNYNQSPTYLDIPVSDYFIVPAGHSMYVYMFDFQPYPGFNYFFQISNSKNLYFDSSANHTVSYLPFNTDEYQQIKQAFYSQKIANSFGSIGDDVKRLADYFVSPEKQTAEEASQQVIDDTLDGFTGSGSAAAKGSDIGSMKNISGSVQSGLDSGGSAGDAASVFTDTHFWEWFTQTTSDGINNPYPAPVVNQRRGSGDAIPDFISGDKDELDSIRNRRDRW